MKVVAFCGKTVLIPIRKRGSIGCEERNNLRLVLQVLYVGLITGIVVGFFRYEIDKTEAFWLDLFKKSHQNPLWFIVIVAGLVLTGITAGYFVKQYPYIGGFDIPKVKLQM